MSSRSTQASGCSDYLYSCKAAPATKGSPPVLTNQTGFFQRSLFATTKVRLHPS